MFSEVGILIKGRMQAMLPLPFSQCQTLSFIADKEKPSMQDVARHFKITAPSATFLVEELARSGLITRHANSKDRRKVEVMLTQKGKTVFKKIIKVREKVLHRMFQTLTESDRADLNRILKKITAT